MVTERVRLSSLHLQHDGEAMSRFLRVLAPCGETKCNVVLDLTIAHSSDAEGAAVVAALVLHRQVLGGRTRLDCATVRDGLRKQFGRWKLSQLFGLNNFPWTDNAIPLLHQKDLDGEAVELYIGTEIKSGKNMPSMTPVLVKETNRSLCELFCNVFEHARSPCGGLAIGGFYPMKRWVQFWSAIQDWG